jgi:hypothetical protein
VHACRGCSRRRMRKESDDLGSIGIKTSDGRQPPLGWKIRALELTTITLVSSSFAKRAFCPTKRHFQPIAQLYDRMSVFTESKKSGVGPKTNIKNGAFVIKEKSLTRTKIDGFGQRKIVVDPHPSSCLFLPVLAWRGAAPSVSTG